MEKGSQPQTEKPPTPPNADDTKFHIELEYDLLRGSLIMKSKAPTVMLSGILRKAENSPFLAIAPAGQGRRVIVDYDMITDIAIVRTDAHDVIARGIFVMAYSMMTQSQVHQQLQKMQGKQIVRPS